MNEPLLTGSARKRLFCRSATTSSAKPRIHTARPTYANTSSSWGSVDVTAASAAARVRLTHSPCSVQVLKKRENELHQASRDGVEDYRALYLLAHEVDIARGRGRNAEADAAQRLMDEAIENVVAWQAKTIDEITRQTREYEVDFEMLLEYRLRIANEIIRLRDAATEDE